MSTCLHKLLDMRTAHLTSFSPMYARQHYQREQVHILILRPWECSQRTVEWTVDVATAMGSGQRREFDSARCTMFQVKVSTAPTSFWSQIFESSRMWLFPASKKMSRKPNANHVPRCLRWGQRSKRPSIPFWDNLHPYLWQYSSYFASSEVLPCLKRTRNLYCQLNMLTYGTKQLHVVCSLWPFVKERRMESHILGQRNQAQWAVSIAMMNLGWPSTSGELK